MAYIPNTNIWASENGKEIYYQNDPPKGIRAVLIATRGEIVNPFFVKKYGLQEQAPQPVLETVLDVETVAETHITEEAKEIEVETKVVKPETPEKVFKPKHKHDRQ
jgi:hypothetical protein